MSLEKTRKSYNYHAKNLFDAISTFYYLDIIILNLESVQCHSKLDV